MSNINVNRSLSDQFYRYKMPRLLAKVEEKGNGIKTVVVNMVEVAKALNRPPTYPTKYFGCELGAQTQFDLKNERYVVNGSHEAAKLQDLLDGFIRKFVLCASCNNPETVLTVLPRTGLINTKCIACGYSGQLDSTHKLTTFILKNPPGQDPTKNAKSGKKGRRRRKGDKTPKRQQNGDGNESHSPQHESDQENGWPEKGLSTEVKEHETSCKQCLQRLFPSLSINDSLPYSEWLSEFETQAAQEVQSASLSGGEIDELQARLQVIEGERDDLKAKVAHFSNTLIETDEMLKALGESAKQQEVKFSEELRLKEQELQKVSEELKSLNKLKEELHSSIEEQEQLKAENLALRDTLNMLESEKLSLEQKFEEIANNCVNLQNEIDDKCLQIEGLQREIASVDHLKKELEDSRLKLEKEKKINKDFSSQMVKLNSLVKIGQDALQQEQENVQKLKSQLSEKLSTANGTSNEALTTATEEGPH